MTEVSGTGPGARNSIQVSHVGSRGPKYWPPSAAFPGTLAELGQKQNSWVRAAAIAGGGFTLCATMLVSFINLFFCCETISKSIFLAIFKEHNTLLLTIATTISWNDSPDLTVVRCHLTNLKGRLGREYFKSYVWVESWVSAFPFFKDFFVFFKNIYFLEDFIYLKVESYREKQRERENERREKRFIYLPERQS